MDIFSQPQKTLLKRQSKQLKKELKVFKARVKKKSESNKKPKINKDGSLGERIIAKYLNDYAYEHIREFPIPEISKHITHPLRFDFYLPSYLIAIEFDGEQHYKKSIFDTKSCNLKTRQERDRRKDLYCLTKGIEMIRISYKDIKNISLILDERIKL